MNLDVLLTLFQIGMLLFILLGTIRMIGADKRSLKMALFAFAVASVLLSDLYWLAYGILRPGTRMPFAANEIGEWALFLLLGASLTSQHPIRFQSAKPEILCAALFSAANAALWVAWSGEWVQDILTGVVFGYFLCALVWRVKEENAFSASMWRFCGILCIILIAAQTATFFAPEPVGKPLDLFCYGLLFIGAAVFIVRAVLSLRKDTEPTQCVCHSFAAFAWTVTTMYMSSGGFYNVAMVLSTLCFLLMYLALRKEVAAA